MSSGVAVSRRPVLALLASLCVALGGLLVVSAPALAELKYKFGFSFGAFKGAVGLAVDNSGSADKGDVYVVSQEENKVDEFNAAGTMEVAPAAEVPETPDQLTVDDYAAGGNEGNVYVASYDGGKVYSFHPGLTSKEEVAKDLDQPVGVAVDNLGRFFVALHDKQVLEYNAQWEPVNAKGVVVQAGENVVVESTLEGIQAVAVSADGRTLYLATNGMTFGHGGTYEYKMEGAVYKEVNKLGEGFSNGVTVVLSGAVFVDEANGTIVEYESGLKEELLGLGLSGEGYGVGVNEASGDVYAADHNNGIVQVLEPNVRSQLALTVEKEGNGASEGEVTSTLAGIECGAKCSAEFEEDKVFILKVTGATVTEWTGCAAEPEPDECEVAMNVARTVKVHLEPHTEFPLSVFITGAGTVTSTPAGIACSTEVCTPHEFEGKVTLRAEPSPGSVFGGWVGCPHTAPGECEVDVTAATEVTAVFLKAGPEGPTGAEGPKGTEGSKGTSGENGTNGENGKEGSPGKEGPPGTEGPLGKVGAQGPSGPAGAQGPAGPVGPAGQVELVTCRKANGKRHCTSKLVSGTVKFTTAGSSAQATLSRHGVVYAAGTARTARGGMSLRLLPVRRLRPGQYTLTLISGTGPQERIATESFTLR